MPLTVFSTGKKKVHKESHMEQWMMIFVFTGSSDVRVFLALDPKTIK